MLNMIPERVHHILESIPEDSLREVNADYEKTKKLFDNACLEIARRYNSYYKDGKPRKAMIIEIVAKTTCVACIDRELKMDIVNRVDTLYKECHQQACNILVEELYDRFNSLGLTVEISTEKLIEYCKADVLILPNGHGISLVRDKKEVAVEVKTGYSLSLIQLYRYIIDDPNRDLVLWRIRNKQILIFDGASLKPLLIQFMKMFILRANRFLAGIDIPCKHNLEHANWSPNQQQLQEAFMDFAHSVVETLPCVVEVVAQILGE